MSEETYQRLAANLTRVRERIVVAAHKTGRTADDLTLVAVTKSVGLNEIRLLLQLGIKHLGENRLQSAQTKIEALAAEVAAAGARWHMLGHLQTNKAKQVLQRFDNVDAVDSLHVLETLAKEAQKVGRRNVPCLAEVNVSGEAQKYGLQPADLEAFLKRAAELPEIHLRGLMTMAPYADTVGQVEVVSRPVFRGLRDLRERATAANWYGQPLTELSMGMTNDYEIAIEEGATIVRVGTGLFA